MEINRGDKLILGLWAVILVLLIRLFSIQIVDDSYKRDAANNSMVYHTIYPPRGIIYDRKGEVLVGNRTCYDILVTPREVTAFDTLALAQALDLDTLWIREQMAYYRKCVSRREPTTSPASAGRCEQCGSTRSMQAAICWDTFPR